MGKIAIIDYGVGNLKSIGNALAYLGLSSEIVAEPKALSEADAIILPGVGAFPDAAEKLNTSGMARAFLQEVGKKPVLGICLGMQLLFDRSYEIRETAGLSLIHGEVKRIETRLKLPQIGWNSLHFQNGSPLFRGVEEGAYVYFVHSYAGFAAEEKNVTAWTDYGTPVVAAVQEGMIFGTQFHPEKSGDVGLQILKNFGDLSL